MFMIAHRANIHGSNPDTENTVPAIRKAFDAGFDVEIDVLSATGNKLFIGHDEVCDTLILNEFESYHMCRFWFHAKTFHALEHLLTLKELHGYKYDVFFHDQDFCTLTANKFIWMYPNPNFEKFVGRKNVIVMPETVGIKPNMLKPFHAFAICTDKPYLYAGLDV